MAAAPVLAVGVAVGGLGDPTHDADRLHGVVTAGRLAREHYGVGPVVDRVGHVGDLGACRPRTFLHGVQHLGGRDREPIVEVGLANDLLLERGHVPKRRLDREVSARDHDSVEGLHDLLEALDGLGLLDLGDQAGLVGVGLGGLVDLEHVVLVADEGQGHVVDLVLQAPDQVLVVLLGHRGHVEARVGEVDPLALLEQSSVDDFAIQGHLALIDLEDLELDQAVVEEDPVADLGVGRERLQGGPDHVRVRALGEACHDLDLLALDEVDGPVGEIRGPDLGAAEVLEDRDRAPELLLDLADPLEDLEVTLVVAVAEVQPAHVHSGLDQLAQRLERRARGTDRGHDLSLGGRVVHEGLRRAGEGAGSPGRCLSATREAAEGVVTRGPVRPRIQVGFRHGDLPTWPSQATSRSSPWETCFSRFTKTA